MKYYERYIKLRDDAWRAFEALVRQGAVFPALSAVTCPRGVRPPGLAINAQGDSWFYAKALKANPDYKLHIGEDLIVGTTPVVFIDAEGMSREVEPDILDLYWLSQLLDGAAKPRLSWLKGWVGRPKLIR